jgi:hypothetical protein
MTWNPLESHVEDGSEFSRAPVHARGARIPAIKHFPYIDELKWVASTLSGRKIEDLRGLEDKEL